MKDKNLIIYYRFDYLEVSRYPFFNKLIEEASKNSDIYLLDMCNTDVSSLKITKQYRLKYILEKRVRSKKIFVFLLKWISLMLAIFIRPKNIIIIGAGAIDVIPFLKKRTHSKVVYIDDEFPWIFRKDAEFVRYCLNNSDVVVSHDIFREKKLIDTLNLDKEINYHVFPNIPADHQLKVNQNIDWVNRLCLDLNSKYVLFHNSSYKFTQLVEVLTSFPLWRRDISLIILGWNEELDNMFKHLLDKRIITTGFIEDNEEYNSIIKFCFTSINLYSKYSDLEYVGKSSGKIMRTILLKKPVIANNYESLKFIEDQNAGCLINHVLELPSVLEKMIDMNFYDLNSNQNSFNFNFLIE